MLHGYVFILHVVGLRLRRVERSVHILRDVYFALLATRAGHARDAANGLFARLDETAGLCIQLLQKLGDQPALLVCQGISQMRLLNLLILILYGDGLRRLQRLQRFLREFLCVHKGSPPLTFFDYYRLSIPVCQMNKL